MKDRCIRILILEEEPREIVLHVGVSNIEREGKNDIIKNCKDLTET